MSTSLLSHFFRFPVSSDDRAMYDTSIESIDILQRLVISNRELAESKYWRGGCPASQAHLHSTHILSCRHIVLL